MKPREKTDEELKELVRDVFAGHVFCDSMIPDGHKQNAITFTLGMVFMPLSLMSKEDGMKFLELEPAMVYEYMDQAGERSCNGLPMFMSLKVLNTADHDAFLELFEEYLEMQQGYMASKH